MTNQEAYEALTGKTDAAPVAPKLGLRPTPTWAVMLRLTPVPPAKEAKEGDRQPDPQ